MQPTAIAPDFARADAFQYYPASTFPTIHPIHWLHSHFAVGGWSPLQRLSGMLTAHMTAIAPHNGFTWHPHRGLEIYTWVLEGTLYHEDTTGGRGEISAGELQRMFSGDWIEHQELNPFDEPARVIQIWFAADPKYRGLQPHYEQLRRDQLPTRMNGGLKITSLVGDDSPVDHHVDARLSAIDVQPGGTGFLPLPAADEDLFLYVTDGAGCAEHGGMDYMLGQYDVILARENASPVTLTAAPDSTLHALAFYLPKFLK
jgi:redox-sensitive bicupin YhaK (pirin superfamily)